MFIILSKSKERSRYSSLLFKEVEKMKERNSVVEEVLFHALLKECERVKKSGGDRYGPLPLKEVERVLRSHERNACDEKGG